MYANDTLPGPFREEPSVTEIIGSLCRISVASREEAIYLDKLATREYTGLTRRMINAR